MKTGVKLIGLLAALLFSSACADRSTGAQGRVFDAAMVSAFSEEKVQLNLASVARQNPEFAAANEPLLDAGSPKTRIAAAPADSEILLPAGTRLVALVDHGCLADPKGKNAALAREISRTATRIEALRLQAYAWSFARDMTLAELRSTAAQDPCLVGLSNGADFVAKAAVNDPYSPQQKHLDTIQAGAAWDHLKALAGGVTQEVVVAVVDNGIDYNHEDLKDRMWRGPNGTYGYNFLANNSDPMDDNDHGTHVAGLIGANVNNGKGVAGVSANTARLMAIKVMSKGTGNAEAFINGVNWAVQNKAEVINMSLGADKEVPMLEAALRAAVQSGAFLTTAAGNQGKAIGAGYMEYPTVYTKDIAGFVSVGAIDTATGQRSFFSTYGPEYIELSAPGSSNTVGLGSTGMGNMYIFLGGTSMATPLVSGAAALSLAAIRSRGYAKVTPADLESLLVDSAAVRDDLKASFRDGKTLDLLALAKLIDARFPAPSAPAPTATPVPQPQPTPAPSTPAPQQPAPTPTPAQPAPQQPTPGQPTPPPAATPAPQQPAPTPAQPAPTPVEPPAPAWMDRMRLAVDLDREDRYIEVEIKLAGLSSLQMLQIQRVDYVYKSATGADVVQSSRLHFLNFAKNFRMPSTNQEIEAQIVLKTGQVVKKVHSLTTPTQRPTTGWFPFFFF